MKKLFVAATVLALTCTLTFANGSKDTAKANVPQGKVLNIYCWNDEFQTRFKDYFEAKGLVPADVKVNWIITPSQGNAYQNKLDEVLLKQKDAAPDDRVDIFLVEADYALKYVDTPYTIPVKDLGITDKDLAQQYKYTKDIMTDSKGVLKGVSWQACPGGYIYRRSIAKAVLGTDDPDKVQDALSTWDKFNAVAAKAKAKGYFMLSGFDDAYRVFSDNMKSPWVKGNKINVDPAIKAWVSQTKTYTDNGYNNKANLWSSESFKGAAKDGKVFGYFGPGWFEDFCLAPATLDDPDGPKAIGNGSYGDWAVCKGPQGFSWGGTWICGATGSDNTKLIHDVMYTITCDKATLVAIAKDKGDFTNSVEAMTELAKDPSYKNPFLGGQNNIAVFLSSAQSIDKSNMTMYDQGMTEKLQAAFADYFNGTVDENTAWNNFYTSILETYPNLQK